MSRPKGRIHTPSSTKRACTASISTGSSSSTTPIAPRTRTSLTCLLSTIGDSPIRRSCSIRPISAFQSPEQSRSMLLAATAHARGLAIKVGPCMKVGFGPPSMTSTTASLVSVAAKLIIPPVIALPTHIMSGTTSACSTANIVPVRPKPVAISSTIRSSPSRSQISRIPRR